ncbi:PqqD family protein [Microtetraspora niveoalba]|uniref:PqqD family protein n=1 Tax=Microtetraspora niveoalba TaxID=46175 RepID=UPI0012F83101|nr:PqqD family protein [Microtetraspora niveoalba]
MTGTSRVRLHPLRTRRDGSDWIVGRVETGEFVAFPDIGKRVIELLAEGRPVDGVAERLTAETGTDVDVADFVAALMGVGFVAEIDGRPTGDDGRESPSLPWLKPRHVRWTLRPGVRAGLVALILCGLAALAVRPEIMPSPSVMAWSRFGTVSLLTQIAITWSLVMLHELAHLCTARAAGVPGRITLGSRLQFLVVQTDVSGVWGEEKHVRMTVYLAGMTLDAAIAAAGFVLLCVVPPGGGVHTALSIVVLTQIDAMSFQLLIFMRTDLYFVAQDLAGCRNLYGDGVAYGRFLIGRLTGRGGVSPLARFSRRERSAVRLYTLLLVLGTAVCLAVAGTIVIPALAAIALPAFATLLNGGDAPAVVDAAIVVAVLAGVQGLWVRTWWRRHGPKVRRWSASAAALLSGAVRGG